MSQNNSKVYIFTIALTAVAAIVLAGLFTVLKPFHVANEALFTKQSILKSIESSLDKPSSQMTLDEVNAVFAKNIKQYVVNTKGEVLSEGAGVAEAISLKAEYAEAEADMKLPVYEFSKDGKKQFILQVRGAGLWDAIWGNIAIDGDKNTLKGVTFNHVAETPGLGAEITDNPNFSKQFIGEKIFDEKKNYKSIKVAKGKSTVGDLHQVDGISGATVTCVGVSDMMVKGLGFYQAYLSK